MMRKCGVALVRRCCTASSISGSSSSHGAARTAMAATATAASPCGSSVPLLTAQSHCNQHHHQQQQQHQQPQHLQCRTFSSALFSAAAESTARPVVASLAQSFLDQPLGDVVNTLPLADRTMGDGRETKLDMSAFPGAESMDPFELASDDMRDVSANIRDLLGVDHPVLSTVAKYFFELDGGKKIRPTMVMLMARAIGAHTLATGTDIGEEATARQRRLAEITELIHTASLLHDDVIDMADTRRGVGSVNKMFGNKLAVLAGDFLLARASVCLARLRNVEVVELLSTVIEHLVKGEVMQMSHALRNEKATSAAFDMYMTKTYYKTASLMANSCKAAALLAEMDGDDADDVTSVAFEYGKHIGLAFQVIDDMLDFTATSDALGKPSLNDLKQGLTTAPVLFASRDEPALLKLIERKFEAPGDVEQAVHAVSACDALERTRALAVQHAQIGLAALERLHPSPQRDALAAVAMRVVNRQF